MRRITSEHPDPIALYCLLGVDVLLREEPDEDDDEDEEKHDSGDEDDDTDEGYSE